jgi:DNA-directed RNA polymerase specialized sigma24 family protein
MSHLDDQPRDGSAGGKWFTTTHWSIVLAAKQSDALKSQTALEQLCRTYWYPLYAYVRRRGNNPHDAQDLTQGFFARLLEDNFLGRVQSDKGKFRSFLLATMNHFLANEKDRAGAAKRGGGREILSLDAEPAEDRYKFEPSSDVTAEVLYERRWAWTILERALKRLREEFAKAGKAEQFDHLKGFLEGETGSGEYVELAQVMGTTPSSLAVSVHRLRQRYQELVRAEIADTVASPADIEEEMRSLLAALAG